MNYTPIFEKTFEGETFRFVVPYKSFVGETEDDAWKIGIGASLVEGIIMGFKFNNKTINIDNATGVLYNLGQWEVYVIETELNN